MKNLSDHEIQTPEKVSNTVKKHGVEICKIKRKLFCPSKIKQQFSITDECSPCE